MNRLLRILVVFVLLVLPATSASSWAPFQQEREMQTFAIENTTGAYQDTSISTSTIIAGTHRLFGFAVMVSDTSKGSELVVSVIDTVPNGSGSTVNEVVAEAEARDQESANVFFPFGKRIHTQVTIRQGPNTSVLVYYGR